MFHHIPRLVLDRMQHLEQLDAKDREDGTSRLQRLRQIPVQTGKFISLMAGGVPAGALIEIGTSAGYSSLWLALACRETGRKLTTFEILEDKAQIAKETFRLTEVEDCVELIQGDALRHLDNYKNVAFCFLDAEKEVYEDCYEAVIPNLVSGGILIADNAIDHKEMLQPMLDSALNDEQVDALIVPVGNGVLLCRKI